MSAANTRTYKYREQDLVDQIAGDSGLPRSPYQEYDRDQLLALVRLLLSFIAMMLAKVGAGTAGEFTEKVDRMVFSARKNSGTSSMRPSSDMPGNKGKKEAAGKPEEKEEKKGKEAPAASTAAEDGKKSPEDQAREFAEKEKSSEEAFRKDHRRSTRKSTGRPKGKQKGAKGFGFKIPGNVDEKKTVIIPPGRCEGCRRWPECMKNASLGAGHNVFDIEIKVTQTAYKTATVECPEGKAGCAEGAEGSEGKGDANVFSSSYPEEAAGPNQYGTQVKSIVCLMYCIGMTSLGRIREILAPWFGMKLSEATMLSFIKALAGLVRPAVDAILQAEHDAPFAHLDETGANVGGKLHWIHAVATPLYTFVSIQAKRGKEGMDAIGFLLEYTGTVIHDCWAPYFKYDGLEHALCNAHLERELAGVSKFFENASKWADDMNSLLREMLRAKHEAQGQGLDSLAMEKIEGFSERFDALIKRGLELHPLPPQVPGKKGRPKKGKARALLERMAERKEEIFRFLTSFEIPYTNNCAERCFRLLGTKRHVGFFQSLEYAEYFCAIWSYMSTAHKHGISYYKAAVEAFKGNARELLFPEKESKKDEAPKQAG